MKKNIKLLYQKYQRLNGCTKKEFKEEFIGTIIVIILITPLMIGITILTPKIPSKFELFADRTIWMLYGLTVISMIRNLFLIIKNDKYLSN